MVASHDRTDPLDFDKPLFGRLHQCVHGSEMPRQVAGVDVTDSRDSEPVKHALERLLLGSLQRFDEVLRRDFTEAFEL